MPYNSVPTSYLSPFVSPWQTVANLDNPGEPFLLELAKSLALVEGITPLTEVFPDETIEARLVAIQQIFQGVDTIFPLVEPGQPDVILSGEKGTVRQMYVEPLYIRQSGSFSPDKINYQIREGTSNDRKPPEEIIQEEIARMTREHNLTWAVYRARMLLGGINYTDPRTGVSAKVSARIPAWNVWHYANRNGYRGRVEATFFRSIVDSYSAGADTALSGVPWTHPDADVVNMVRRFARWFSVQNKSKLTGIYMHADMLEVIAQNNQIRLAEGGVLFNTYTASGTPLNITASAQQAVPLVVPSTGTDAAVSRAITMGPEGITAIAGIPIYTINTKYKDPVDGVWKMVWPKNKVVFVSQVDPQGTFEAAGRTQYCIGENIGGAPGMWIRYQNETQVPAAPGQYVQMGNAGLPYLKYPYRVAHCTVASVQDINDRLGVLPDQDFGIY